MVLKHYDFEGGTDGATVTTALSGASQVTLNGGSAVFDAAAAHNGALGIKITNVSGSAAIARFTTDAPNNTMAFEVGFTAPSVASSAAAPQILSVRNSSGQALRVVIDTGGRINVDGATATGYLLAHSGLVAGSHYRLAVLAQVGTTTSNGVLKTNLYAENSTTPIGSQYVNTAFNLGTTPIAACDIGIVNAASASYPMSFDDVRFLDGSTTEIGPVPVTTVTVTPTSITDNSGAFTNQGGAASLQAALADASDTTYIESPTAPVNKPITAAIGTLAAGSVKVTVRARMQPVGGPATTVKIELLQGATVIAAGTATTVTDTFADYVLALTTAQNNAITDRTALRVRITANQP